MPWDLYECKFRIKSPLHIGFHKVLILSRTRSYVPGKLIWAALTAKLTPLLGINDYQKVGEFLKKAVRFGYFYPCVDDTLYLPQYTEEGLKFGHLPQTDFEKRFISSIASTAIQPQSLTAEEGTLHEIEFISPYKIDDGKKVYLKGLLWVNEVSENGFIISKNDDGFTLSYNGKSQDFKKGCQLQVGGERKYGFGLIELEEVKLIDRNDKDLNKIGFFGKWEESENEVRISLEEDQWVWVHVKYNSELKIKGSIEPLVGREWDYINNKGAGRKIVVHGLFWVPGSVLAEKSLFKITEFGFWEKV